MFIDSHCHLDRLDLTPYNGSLEAALLAAKQAGVDKILCVGVDENNAGTVVELAQTHQDVFAAVGLHPLDCKAAQPNMQVLEQLLTQPKVVAIGETGLDYHYVTDTELHDAQRSTFIQHLQLGVQYKLPVIVHTRNAQQDTLDAIQSDGDLETGGVLHCFTESLEMAKAAMDLNYYISISGIVTFNNASALREVVRYLPLDRLLIETDAPYLTPIPHRGKSNEPKFVADVARYIASLKGLSPEKLGEITTGNFHHLFTKTTLLV